MTKRVGLLGGTFDPVHIGHLQAASAVKATLQLDEIHLLPLSTPVHKSSSIANDQQRLHCLRLALQSFPDLQIETAELDRAGESYTVDTLQYLHAQNRDTQYYLLLGVDAFNSFPSWKKPEEILQLANVVIVNRPDNTLSSSVLEKYKAYFCNIDELREKAAGAIVNINIAPIAISSTQLRALLADENYKDAAHYIPQLVLSYISQEKIYSQKREPMNVEEIKNQIVNALDDIKGIDITVLPVGEMTSVADYLVVTSGSSDRQVKALANNVLTTLKSQDIRPLGVEGEREGQWILIDYADILVHIMLPDVRDFYNLEKLWEHRPSTVEENSV